LITMFHINLSVVVDMAIPSFYCSSFYFLRIKKYVQ
jgi:hypothetical protein